MPYSTAWPLVTCVQTTQESSPRIDSGAQASETNLLQLVRMAFFGKKTILSSVVTCFLAAPVNGGWGEWGTWKCEASCGKSSVQHRTRICNNPTPLDGGSDCVGDRVEEKKEECKSGTTCTCSDGSSSCPNWKTSGYCNPGNRYASWMKANCATTCGFCPSKNFNYAHFV
jgi:hypothetical protein